MTDLFSMNWSLREGFRYLEVVIDGVEVVDERERHFGRGRQPRPERPRRLNQRLPTCKTVTSTYKTVKATYKTVKARF